MLFWVFLSSSLVIGFHFFLKSAVSSKGELSSNLHPIRRFQHLATGLILSLIYCVSPHDLTRIMITVPTVSFLLFDIARRKYSPALNQWFLHHWEHLLRPHEKYNRPPSAFFFLLGRMIAHLAMLFVSICDPAASVFGILIGGLKITEKKSVAGTSAAGVFGMIVTAIVAYAYEREVNVVFGGIIALVAEIVDVKVIDDNFTIPVITCLLWRCVLGV
jgi:dolichol kinase